MAELLRDSMDGRRAPRNGYQPHFEIPESGLTPVAHPAHLVVGISANQHERETLLVMAQ
jgi:hypothetical protein